eukprot:GHVN01021871.1.p2 GENE.GHVN01021871.1~~GHVN01021871.1.p2  ORF type:complete len:116 (+),score=68.30 GHVN01021871.1:90-437(+)
MMVASGVIGRLGPLRPPSDTHSPNLTRSSNLTHSPNLTHINRTSHSPHLTQSRFIRLTRSADDWGSLKEAVESCSGGQTEANEVNEVSEVNYVSEVSEVKEVSEVGGLSCRKTLR